MNRLAAFRSNFINRQVQNFKSVILQHQLLYGVNGLACELVFSHA